MSPGAILAAAARCRPWREGASKVYLCDVAAELGTTVAALAPSLVALHRERGCLARADLVDAFDGAKLSASTVENGIFGGVQLLDLAARPAPKPSFRPRVDLRARYAEMVAARRGAPAR